MKSNPRLAVTLRALADTIEMGDDIIDGQLCMEHPGSITLWDEECDGPRRTLSLHELVGDLIDCREDCDDNDDSFVPVLKAWASIFTKAASRINRSIASVKTDA